MPQLQPTASDLLADALAIARSLESENFRVKALMAIIPRLTATDLPLLAEALQATCYIVAVEPRSQLLATLATQLPPRESQALLNGALIATRQLGKWETSIPSLVAIHQIQALVEIASDYQTRATDSRPRRSLAQCLQP